MFLYICHQNSLKSHYVKNGNKHPFYYHETLTSTRHKYKRSHAHPPRHKMTAVATRELQLMNFPDISFSIHQHSLCNSPSSIDFFSYYQQTISSIHTSFAFFFPTYEFPRYLLLSPDPWEAVIHCRCNSET